MPEVSDEIEYVPAQFMRVKHVRSQKRCNVCAKIITAPAPVRVGEGLVFGPRFHAHAVVTKCADSIPFYRLAKRFQRDGMPIQRSTLNRLFHRSAEILSPISRRIMEKVVNSEHVNADETPLMVQAPEKCHRGYMWVFMSNRLIGYEFSPGRGGETPERLLKCTKGSLQVDYYSGYNPVCAPESRERVGCMAHVRREFFRALSYAPHDAQEALEQILKLYDVEYEAAVKGVLYQAEHQTLRRLQSKPLLESMIKWVSAKKGCYPPQSPMGSALGYASKVLPSLNAAMEDARIRLDNNIAENALRTVALGRKNYLFVGDNESGRNLATLQTIVSTCIANDVNPEAYMADVLLRLDSTPSSKIDELLPMNWKPAAQNTTALTGDK